MYFFNDTHHGTFFNTFSLIYWLEIKRKTCQFGNILDLTTRSTSSQRFFGIHFGCGEKKLFNNPFQDLFYYQKVFEKTYHFMKSACISSMILTMALFSPPFLDLLAENKMKTCQFGNILDLTMHSTSSQRFFGIHFGCGEKKTF